jgi:glycosyltransferase involved in cell wall biosynthesis
VVIYNGIDLEKYANAEKMIGKKNILFLGRLTNQKGAYFFLHAAKIVLEKEKDVSFIIVGKGDQMPELINLAIELGIHDKVRFTGYIPEEQIPLAYAHCNAYVMPSITEPFGITALEAMATGTPLIVSKNAGVSETVKHCFKVDFWDTYEMANKIVSILRYPVLEKVMGENSKKEVVSFGWDKVAEQTLSTYGRFA